jgi:hypothetical protein
MIGGSIVKNAARTMMSWILLSAMLVSLPGEATGRFVCLRGMAQAGPACPRCRGHASNQEPRTAIGKRCCTFVGGQRTPDARLAIAQVEQPIPGQATALPADAGFLRVLDRDGMAPANQGAIPRTRASSYLSNFLRL